MSGSFRNIAHGEPVDVGDVFVPAIDLSELVTEIRHVRRILEVKQFAVDIEVPEIKVPEIKVPDVKPPDIYVTVPNFPPFPEIPSAKIDLVNQSTFPWRRFFAVWTIFWLANLVLSAVDHLHLK